MAALYFSKHRNNCVAKTESVFVKNTLGKRNIGGNYYRNRRFHYRLILEIHLDTEHFNIIRGIINTEKHIIETCHTNTDRKQLLLMMVKSRYS